jgi:hypothetical protein
MHPSDAVRAGTLGTPVRFAIATLIFAGACVACAPATPVTKSTPGTKSALGPNVTCTGTDFVNRIIVLPIATAQPLTSAEQTDLSNAYCNASEAFRRQLDNIDYVFVDAGACGTKGDPGTCTGLTGAQALGVGWGQRARAGYTQIGIPAGLWPTGQAAGPYPSYESDLLDKLVPWSLSTDQLKFSAPTNPNNANTSWMTILAALAHEAGHVRWYEATVRSGFGQPYDFRRLTDCNFFVGWQYNAPTNAKKLEPKGRWRTFGSTANESTNNHATAPDWTQFLPGANDDPTLDNLLAQLLSGNSPWASFLASETPDEDFVETFKFAVLVDAGLNSLPIAIPTSSGKVNVDIPANYLAGNNTYLANKVQCIRRWT